jgi:hypothetical protein
VVVEYLVGLICKKGAAAGAPPPPLTRGKLMR